MVSARNFYIFLIASVVLFPIDAKAQLAKSSPFLFQKNYLKADLNSKQAVALLDIPCARLGGDPGVHELVLKSAKFPEYNSSNIQAVLFDIQNITPKELNRIVQSDCVLGLEENREVHTAQVSLNDPMFPQQKFYSSIQFQEGRKLFLSPAFDRFQTVVVGIIDSGIDTKHPEFLGRLWRGPNGEIGHNFQNEEAPPEDDFGHGTHVSGLVAANANNGIGVVGVSAQAQLMVVKTQDNQGEGNLADLISGIRYAVDNGAEVLNISLSVSGDSPGLRDAIDYALERNVVVVTAAGNQAMEITPTQFFTPSGYANTRPGLISVGSVDGIDQKLSWFSNYSETYVKIAAPGSYGSDQILSTYLNQGYRGSDGTSMASPIVVGSAVQLVSYMKSAGISVTPKLVEEALLAGSTVNSDLTGKIKDQKQLNFLSLGKYILNHFHLSSSGGFDE